MTTKAIECCIESWCIREDVSLMNLLRSCKLLDDVFSLVRNIDARESMMTSLTGLGGDAPEASANNVGRVTPRTYVRAREMAM